MVPLSASRSWLGPLVVAGSIATHALVAAACLALAPRSNARAATPPPSEVDVMVETVVTPAEHPVAPEPPSNPPPAESPPAAPRAAPAREASSAPAPAPAAPPQQADAVATADAPLPSFTIFVGPGTAPAHGVVANEGAVAPAPASAAVAPRADLDAPLPASLVSSPARLLRGAPPPYPPGARADGIEGVVPVELIVSTTGTVESVRVLKSFGHGLDEAAVAAARRYRFSPAMKDGHPVRVRMPWTMQFHLE